MTAMPTRLLLLEDSAGDARLVQEALADQAPGEFAITTVERLADALARIQAERFDAVLCDLGLPDSAGLGTAKAIVAGAPALALVVLTGSHNEDLGRAAIQLGAQDYLVKGETRAPTIARTLRYAIERKRLQNELRKAIETLERRVAERTAELETTNNFLRANVARYQAVTQTATDAIVTADATGAIMGWNLAAERSFGYTEAEVLGQSLTMLMPQRFRDAHSGGMQRLLAGGKRHVIGKTVELCGLTKTGEEFPLDLSLSEWETSEGRFFTGIIRNIRERKRVEQTLEENRWLLNAIVNGTSDAVYVKDRLGRYLMFNTAAERLTGKSASDTLGKDDRFLFPPEEAATVMNSDCKVMESGTTATYEEVVTGADGRVVTFLSTKGPIFDASGKPTGLFGIARDITERKQTEEKNTRQLDELQRWQDVMLGREDRVRELKAEVNELCRRMGEAAPYPSQEAGPADSDAAKPHA